MHREGEIKEVVALRFHAHHCLPQSLLVEAHVATLARLAESQMGMLDVDLSTSDLYST